MINKPLRKYIFLDRNARRPGFGEFVMVVLQ